MGKKDFTIEEKIKATELHIHNGMGYGAISDRYGVPITTLRQHKLNCLHRLLTAAYWRLPKRKPGPHF